MFREMRRKKQQLTDEEAVAILRRGSSGVLATAGDGGYPYAVPLSYAYHGGKLYFHCAMAGHKLDAIARDDKASFCVVDRDMVVPEAFTTRYRSVIVFGRARVLTDAAERRQALLLLAEKYSPGRAAQAAQSIEAEWDRVCLVALTIEHITGKAARESG